MKAILRRIAERIANEPVVTISTALGALVGFLGPFVVADFDPAAFDARYGVYLTAFANVVGWIARQFVTPTRKLTRNLIDGQSSVVSTELMTAVPSDGEVPDVPYPYETEEEAEAALAAVEGSE